MEASTRLRGTTGTGDANLEGEEVGAQEHMPQALPRCTISFQGPTTNTAVTKERARRRPSLVSSNRTYADSQVNPIDMISRSLVDEDDDEDEDDNRSIADDHGNDIYSNSILDKNMRLFQQQQQQRDQRTSASPVSKKEQEEDQAKATVTATTKTTGQDADFEGFDEDDLRGRCIWSNPKELGFIRSSISTPLNTTTTTNNNHHNSSFSDARGATLSDGDGGSGGIGGEGDVGAEPVSTGVLCFTDLNFLTCSTSASMTTNTTTSATPNTGTMGPVTAFFSMYHRHVLHAGSLKAQDKQEEPSSSSLSRQPRQCQTRRRNPISCLDDVDEDGIGLCDGDLERYQEVESQDQDLKLFLLEEDMTSRSLSNVSPPLHLHRDTTKTMTTIATGTSTPSDEFSEITYDLDVCDNNHPKRHFPRYIHVPRSGSSRRRRGTNNKTTADSGDDHSAGSGVSSLHHPLPSQGASEHTSSPTPLARAVLDDSSSVSSESICESDTNQPTCHHRQKRSSPPRTCYPIVNRKTSSQENNENHCRTTLLTTTHEEDAHENDEQHENNNNNRNLNEEIVITITTNTNPAEKEGEFESVSNGQRPPSSSV